MVKYIQAMASTEENEHSLYSDPNAREKNLCQKKSFENGLHRHDHATMIYLQTGNDNFLIVLTKMKNDIFDIWSLELIGFKFTLHNEPEKRVRCHFRKKLSK